MRSPTYRHAWQRHAAGTALLVAALALCIPSAASGASYFVDRDSRGGPCSDVYPLAVAQNDSGRPFCSLDALAPLVPAGAEILVRGGDYGDWRIDNASKSSYVTVRPFEAELVRTTGVEIDSSDHWAVEGVELSGSDPLLGSSYATGRFAVDGSSHIRIEHNDIHDALGGLYSKNGVIDLSFSHNTVHTVRCVGVAASCPDSYKSGYGIATVTGPVIDWRIAENSFSDLDGDGIQMMCTEDCEIVRNRFVDLHARSGNVDHVDALQLSGGADNLLYQGNYVADASKAVCYCSDHVTPRVWHEVVFADNVFFDDGNYCMSVAPTADLQIRNNLCWGNRYSGLNASDDPALQPYADVRVFNNIFGPCTECHGDSVALTAASMGVASWHNNLIVENGQERTYTPSDIVTPGATAISGLFVDSASGDFHLAPGSIAIDAGSTDPYSPVSGFDADGLPRILGTIDIGPYEYGATGVPPAVPDPTPPREGGDDGSPDDGAQTAEAAAATALGDPNSIEPAEAAEPAVGKRRFEVLSVGRRRGIDVLRVGIPQPGHLSMRGSGVRSWEASASRAGVLAMPIRPTRATSAELRRRGRARIGVVLRYRSREAPRSIQRFLELVTRHEGPVLRATRRAIRRAARP